jgi:hypothetical protein
VNDSNLCSTSCDSSSWFAKTDKIINDRDDKKLSRCTISLDSGIASRAYPRTLQRMQHGIQWIVLICFYLLWIMRVCRMISLPLCPPALSLASACTHCIDTGSFSKNTKFFSRSTEFSSKPHFIPDFYPNHIGLFFKTRSSVLDCSRLFCGPYASTGPKNYNYRRLEA